MQRATATAGRWLGALGTGLALPFFAASAQPLDSGMPPVARESPALQSELGRWRGYAQALISPRFTWAEAPRVEAPTVLDSYGAPAGARGFALSSTRPVLQVDIGSMRIGDTPAAMPAGNRLVELPEPGLQRTVLAPSLRHDFGDAGSLRVGAIFAYQRFATPGLGTSADPRHAPMPGWLGDSSHGAGIRLDLGNRLGERLRWNASWQSRVRMGALAHYRGVFTEAGEFDIPAQAGLGLAWQLAPRLELDLGFQRVMYSQVQPFTSEYLPRRFLALLGDSASPVFQWQDLDIYSLGAHHRSARAGHFQLRWSTRQQPRPSSRLLENALSGAVAHHMWTLAWARDFGAHSNLALQASHASSSYWLMMPGWARSGARAGRTEFEALWSTRF